MITLLILVTEVMVIIIINIEIMSLILMAYIIEIARNNGRQLIRKPRIPDDHATPC